MRQKQSQGEFNWKVAGPAGKGIKTTGLIFSKAVFAHGWETFDYTEYPSLITGGHNTYQVFASPKSAVAQRQHLDILVALDKSTLKLHTPELDQSSLVIFDSQGLGLKGKYLGPGRGVDVPLKKLALAATSDQLMANNVALGASAALLGLDLVIFKKIIKKIFGRKGVAIVTANQAAAQVGWDYIQENFAKYQASPIHQTQHSMSPRFALTGNEAISLGAIAGGLQLFAAYPMTPASSILHILAAKANQAKIIVKHAEDEIGTVNLVLGASFAGVRAMTATSGGGFGYMTEAIGLAGVAELPLVIVNSMRPGPALGMPTWTAQGDLQMVISASQDEFPRIVLAPGDATQAFELTRQAFSLAEKYQLPVIILSDKHLSESSFTTYLTSEEFANQRLSLVAKPQADENGFYPRYQITKTGITPRPLPGQVGGTHVANSYEHDVYGIGTEDGSTRIKQVDKRFAKFTALKKEVPPQLLVKKKAAQLTLIGFGSTQGSLLAAQELLLAQNLPINICNLSWLWPFPIKQIEKLLQANQNIAVVEGNSQGQLAALITQQTGHQVKHSLRKYDGRPFYPEEIVEYVKKLVGNKLSLKSDLKVKSKSQKLKKSQQ